MSAVADILNRAADRLAKPGAWTRKASCRSAKGEWIPPRRDGGVCWCMGGAIEAETSHQQPEHAAAFAAIARVIGGYATDPIGSAIRWNDAPGRTQAEVVAALRAAAEAA